MVTPSLGSSALLLGAGSVLGVASQHIKRIFSRLAAVMMAEGNVKLALGTRLRVKLLNEAWVVQRHYGTIYRWWWRHARGVAYPDLQRTIGKNQTLLIYKGRPLWCARTDPHTVQIRWIRGTFNLEKMLEELTQNDIMDLCSKSKVEEQYNFRFYVETYVGVANRESTTFPDTTGNRDAKAGGPPATDGAAEEPPHGEWTVVKPSGVASDAECRLPLKADAFEYVYLTPEQQEVVSDIHYWAQNKAWFEDRGLPWKMGVGLVGPVGTGKTSTIRGVARLLDFPVFFFNLNSMDNAELVRYWERMLQFRPCVVAIEELESVFLDRKNIGGGKLTFETLLNCIDGVRESDGVLLFVSTNKVLDISEALFGATDKPTRPGRIDRVIEFGLIPEDGRLEMAERMCKGCEEGLVERLVAEGDGDTPSQFQGRCTRAALKEFRARDGREEFGSLCGK